MPSALKLNLRISKTSQCSREGSYQRVPAGKRRPRGVGASQKPKPENL